MKFFKSLVVSLLCILMCVSITACAIWDLGYKIQEKKYYSDKSNFIAVTAVCLEVAITERIPERYYINVDDMQYEKKGNNVFVGQTFKIGVSNSAILKEAKIEEKLTPGVVFTFISAPATFGDGYCYPIVGLEIDGEVLLDFEVGYKNLMAEY